MQGGWNFTEDVYNLAAHHPAAKVISWEEPRLVVFPSFITPQEVAHLVVIGKENLVRSNVLSETGGEEASEVRTSFGAFPPRNDGVLNGINERIHKLLGIPKDFGEDIYVLNYKIGQKYDKHNDNCIDFPNASRDLPKTVDDACLKFLRRGCGPECGAAAGGDSCGDRIATVILHLLAPSKGGRTVFPYAQQTNENLEKSRLNTDLSNDDWMCEKEEVLGVRANPGDAVLFWNYKPAHGFSIGSFRDGTAIPAAMPVYGAMHGGCPVLEGEKCKNNNYLYLPL